MGLLSSAIQNLDLHFLSQELGLPHAVSKFRHTVVRTPLWAQGLGSAPNLPPACQTTF